MDKLIQVYTNSYTTYDNNPTATQKSNHTVQLLGNVALALYSMLEPRELDTLYSRCMLSAHNASEG